MGSWEPLEAFTEVSGSYKSSVKPNTLESVTKESDSLVSELLYSSKGSPEYFGARETLKEFRRTIF